ncbi:MAG: serine/threonine-protein kinase, partial [Pirellulaceae bacterium]
MCELEKKAKTIFLSALEIDSDSDREAFINGKCNGNQALRQEVQRLLDHWKGMGSFMESTPPDDTPSATAEYSLDDKPGTLIGDYKLLQRLGEGGMGIVYLAERQHPVKQRVALKIIKHGMDTGQFLARFDAERQALAMMDHPNIAKVLDAGCTENGRPYFVMELVKGVAISTFCDENRLPTRARLELFLQVCQAVHHAHQKGIIHRDLKPSNILVALYDDNPVPKVIDFGVVKATNQHLTERTLFTAVGTIIGTWEYMSPEQAVLNQLDVDTRSDVYALGVLLYELLTGETPLDRQQLREGQLLETFRMIREQEPLKPSTRVSTLGDRATATAAYRSTKPELLASEIRGDLDWIVMKALAKERSRRYDSASRFATDIRRLLANDAVEARPPSLWYQAQKFYQRNKAAVGVVVTVFVGLVIGLGGTLWNLNAVSDARSKLKAKNEELHEILNNWQRELYFHALTAAFSDDHQEVESAINEATKASGSSPDWEPKIRGLLDLFNGRLDNALETLKGAVETQKDPGAEALLACTYLQSGQQDKFIETRNRLETIVSHPEWSELSVEDRLLVGHAIKFGNIEWGEKILANILSNDPSPLAFALHSQILMKQCYDRPNQARRALSLAELKAAQLMMPECAFLAVLEFWA